jgi:uncharacterized cupin superfamily protein
METGISRARLEPHDGDRFTMLRRELGVTTFGMNLISLEPRQVGRIHRHEHQEEVYIVLEGTLTMFVEGEEQVYPQGDIVRVGPELRRQLANRGPGRLLLLALGGSGEHVGRDGMAYPDWEATEPVAPQELPPPADLD